MGLLRIPAGTPIPAGSYWQDITPAALPAWQSWLTRHRGAVIVTSTEETAGEQGSPDVTFFAFTVKTPVPWEGPGYPTIAQGPVTKTEVMQVPTRDELDLPDPLAQLGKAAASGVSWGLAALVVVIGVSLGKWKR